MLHTVVAFAFAGYTSCRRTCVYLYQNEKDVDLPDGIDETRLYEVVRFSSTYMPAAARVWKTH